MVVRLCSVCVLVIGLAVSALAQEPLDDERTTLMRERYETALMRDPLQQRIFDETYALYLRSEGIDAWVEKIENDESVEGWVREVLLGRIYSRQFKNEEAIEKLSAAQKSAPSPERLNSLLARLYYESGEDQQAQELLALALESEEDPEEWDSMVRMLGSIHQRQGQRDEAIATWKRLVEREDASSFAFQELAGIYEDNHLWAEAGAVYKQLAELSKSKPYQRCRALRSWGDVLRRQRDYEGAIALYEEAMGLTAPGSWLFSSLQDRLVSGYQEMGHLAGLVEYLKQRIEAAPADVEYRDLLARTYILQEDYSAAEKTCRAILERNADYIGAYENLIDIYSAQVDYEAEVKVYGDMIAQFPEEIDFIRRLGERHLLAKDEEAAHSAWAQVLGEEKSAASYAQLGDWLDVYDFVDEAIVAYEKAIKMRTDRDWILRTAALYFDNDQKDKAKDLWLSSIDPASSSPAEMSEIASLLEINQFLDEALALHKQVVAAAPDNVQFTLKLADALFKREDFEQAQGVYSGVLESEAEAFFRERSEFGLLKCYESLGTLEEQCQAMETALKEEKDSLELSLKLARYYTFMGRTARSLELYEDALKTSPDEPKMLTVLAEAYQKSHRYKESLGAYEQLIVLDSNRSGAYIEQMLKIYTRLRNKDEAIATAEKLAELRPADAETRIELATTYQAFSEQDKALQQFRYALRLSPKESVYYELYGKALSQENKLGEAQDAYRQMLEVAVTEDSRLQAINYLAMTYKRLGKETVLVDEFKEELRAHPQLVAAYDELAQVQKAINDHKGAMDTIESAVGVVEDEEEILRKVMMMAYETNALNKVIETQRSLMKLSGTTTVDDYERLANTYLRMGDMKGANENWEQMLALNPNDSDVLKRVAKSKADYGLFEEAQLLQMRVLDADPYDYRIRYELAQQLMASSKMEEAVATLQKLLALGERPQKEGEAKSKKAASSSVSSRYSSMSHNSSYRRSYGSYGGRGMQRWQGSYKDFRPHVVSMMFQWANQSGLLTELLGPYEEKLLAEPDNVGVLQDVYKAYSVTNNREKQSETLTALIRFQPDNVQYINHLASLYQQSQKMDEALGVYNAYLERNPTNAKQFMYQIARLMILKEDVDGAVAFMEKELGDPKTNAQMLATIANVFAQANQHDVAETYWAKLEEADPVMASRYQVQRAEYYTREGNDQRAWDLLMNTLEHTLITPTGNPQSNPYSFQNLHNQRFNINSVLTILLPNHNPHVIADVLQCLERLEMVDEAYSLKPFWESVAVKTQTLSDIEDSEERSHALNRTRLLLAWEFSQGKRKEMNELFTVLMNQNSIGTGQDILQLHMMMLNNEPAAVIEFLDTLDLKYPAKKNELDMVRIRQLLAQGELEDATELYKGMLQSSSQSSQMFQLMSEFQRQDAGLYRELLDEYLNKYPNDFNAKRTLVYQYNSAQEHTKAIKLARELWEQGGGGGYSSRNYNSLFSRHGNQRNDKLDLLIQAYSNAQRLPELTREFEERLENEPHSAQALANVMQLYDQRGRRFAKLNLMQKYYENQPHNTQIQLSMMNEYIRMELFEQALEIIESMPRVSPQVFNQQSHNIMRVYTELGEYERLAAFEKKLMQSSRDPQMLQNLANFAGNRGDIKSQRAIYERLIHMNPMNVHMSVQFIQSLLRSGDAEGAIKIWEEKVFPDTSQQYGMNGQFFDQLLVGYEKVGRLDELRATSETVDVKESKSMWAKHLKAELARYDKNYDEAIAVYESLVKLVTHQHYSAEYYWRMASIALENDKPEQAILFTKQSTTNHNSRRFNELAKLFAAKKEFKHAVESWKQYVGMEIRRGNTHASRETFQNMLNYQLWDDAAAFYALYRPKLMMNDYSAKDMDRKLVEHMSNSDALEELASKYIFKVINAQSVEAMRQLMYRNNGNSKLFKERIEQLLAENPDNKGLLNLGVEFYERQNNYDKALELIEGMGEYKELNKQMRQRVIRLLNNSDKREKAYALVYEQFKESPTVDNFQQLVNQLNYVQGQGRLPALIEEALALAKDEHHAGLQRVVDRYKASNGSHANSLDSARSLYQDNPTLNNLQNFVRYLKQNNDNEEIIELAKNETVLDLLGSNSHSGREILEVLVEEEQTDLVNPYIIGLMRRTRNNPGDSLRSLIQNSLNASENEGENYKLSLLDGLIKELKTDKLLWSRRTLYSLLDMLKNAKLYSRAEALCEARLERFPKERATRQKYLEIKQQTLEPAAFVTLLEGEWADIPGSQQRNYAVMVINALVKVDEKEKAVALIDGIELSPNNYQEIKQRGDWYVMAGNHEKAAKDYESYLTGYPDAYRHNKYNLGKIAVSYAHVGKFEEAANLGISTDNQNQVKKVAEILADKDRKDLAVKVIKAHPQSYTQDADLAVKMIGYIRDSEEPYLPTLNECFEVARDNYQRRRLAEKMATYIVDQGILTDILAIEDIQSKQGLGLLLGYIWVKYELDGEHAESLNEAFKRVEFNSPQEILDLENQIRRNGDDDGFDNRFALYQKVIDSPDVSGRHLRDVLNRLNNHRKDTVPVLNMCKVIAEKNPSAFTQNMYIFQSLARSEQVEAANEVVATVVTHLEDKTMARFAEAHYYLSRKDTEEKEVYLTAFKELAMDPKLTRSNKNIIVNRLVNAEEFDAAFTLYEYLVSTAGNNQELAGTYRSLLSLALQTEKKESAILYFAKSFEYSEAGRTNNVVQHIKDVVDSQEDLKALEKYFIELVSENPTHSNIPQMIGIYYQQAQKFGIDETIEEVAKRWNISDKVLAKSFKWTQSIESWGISGPYESENGVKALRKPPEELLQWFGSKGDAALGKMSDPAQITEFVSPYGVIELNYRDHREKAIAATTLIESDRDQEVTYMLDFYGRLSFWHDGEMLYKQTTEDNGRLYNSKVTVSLKKGVNRVMVILNSQRSECKFRMYKVMKSEVGGGVSKSASSAPVNLNRNRSDEEWFPEQEVAYSGAARK